MIILPTNLWQKHEKLVLETHYRYHKHIREKSLTGNGSKYRNKWIWEFNVSEGWLCSGGSHTLPTLRGAHVLTHPSTFPLQTVTHPRKPPSTGLTTQTTYSWKSFSPMHFTGKAEWPKNRYMDHYYCWADKKQIMIPQKVLHKGGFSANTLSFEDFAILIQRRPSSLSLPWDTFCFLMVFWKDGLCFAELQIPKVMVLRCLQGDDTRQLQDRTGRGGCRRDRLTCRGQAVAVHTRLWPWGCRWPRECRARWCPAPRSESGTGAQAVSP